MSLVVIGLNHKTASVEVRELMSISEQKSNQAVDFICKDKGIHSVVIVSTCNRTEFYLSCQKADNALAKICDWYEIEFKQIEKHLYIKSDADCIQHLFQVVAGIDSMILGEVQILGQVKSAYEASAANHKLDTQIDRLFQNAFRVAKTIRSETDIGKNPVSVANSAVQLSRQILGKLSDQNVLMVGAGATSELLLRYLCKHPHHKLSVCNRGIENGTNLAQQFRADFFELNQLKNKLADYDLIFTATSSETPIITLQMVADALKMRKHKPMVIIDIAIPRDTEAKIRKFNDVFYYTVDDLQKVISQNLQSRQQAAINAKSIIETESEMFYSWIKAQQHKNLIHQFQRETAKIRKASLDKALKQLNNGTDPEEVLFFLANNLTKKLNHTPVKALSEVIHSGDTNKINFLKKIMKLEQKENKDDPRD